MEKITVSNIQIDSHKIRIFYEVSKGLEEYFDNQQRAFWLEYSDDVSAVPKSVAIIPFVCNVLPIIWLTNSCLNVPELDKTFYESIDEFKRGYIEMYPMLSFNGQLKVNRIVENTYKADGGNAAFFSGGADAFTTLICHLEEKPILITLRGSDIKLDDLEGWNNVYNHVQSTVKQFDLPSPISITSNFRTFIREWMLSRLVQNSKDGWWHGFQCGIGLIAQAAPLAYIRHFKLVYIASSYTLQDKIPSASYPTIDNYVRFCNTQVVHDQYEHHRQEKIQILIKYYKKTGKRLNLRVCWISRGGMNCCHCEKCIRTMFALMAEGESPYDYGFNYSEDDLLNSKKIVISHLYETNDGVRHDWIHIKERFIETGAYKDDKRINWVYELDPYAKRPKPSIFKRFKDKLHRILH